MSPDSLHTTLIILFGLLGTAALLGVILLHVRRRHQMRYETIRLILDKGQEIPSELLIDPDSPQTWRKKVLTKEERRSSDFRRATFLSMFAIALAIVLYLHGEQPSEAVFALLFLFPALGYLITGFASLSGGR